MLINMKRVFFVVILFLLTFIFPWWVSLTLAFLGAFYFDNFYEMVLVGFVLDTLYGVPDYFFEFPFFFAIISLVVLWVIINLKKRY